jgi:hypothetical protein
MPVGLKLSQCEKNQSNKNKVSTNNSSRTKTKSVEIFQHEKEKPSQYGKLQYEQKSVGTDSSAQK